MDINPNPGPRSVQDNVHPFRSAETHLHVTSQGEQCLSYSRRELLCLRYLGKRTSMSQSTFQMLKFLRIFLYRGKSAGKGKKQAKVLDQPCFDSYVNGMLFYKSLLIVPEQTLKSILIRSNNSHKAPIMS